jgi:hypothetical protein
MASPHLSFFYKAPIVILKMNRIPFLNYDEAKEEFWRKNEKDILNQETIL